MCEGWLGDTWVWHSPLFLQLQPKPVVHHLISWLSVISWRPLASHGTLWLLPHS